jgi:hypothetical protein
MTLQYFKEKAEEIVSEYGIDKNYVTVIAMYSGLHTSSQIGYSIQVWISKESKHVRACQNNVISCLSEFENNMKSHFLKYDKITQDINI